MSAAAAPVIIVTGGFGAIGNAIARHAAEAGAIAVRTGRHPAAEGMAHDVRDAASWRSVMAEVCGRYGRIDALVNAAGQLGGAAQDVLSATPEQWHELLDTHVVGTWLGCAELIRRKPAHQVSIVNIASTAGQLATPGMVAYGAMKAAVIHLTTSVALYCARSGLPIRCNAIAPALVDGGVRDDVLATVANDHDKALHAYLSRVPTGRLVTLEEVAGVAYDLAAGNCPALTGQVVAVAGGLGLA